MQHKTQKQNKQIHLALIARSFYVAFWFSYLSPLPSVCVFLPFSMTYYSRSQVSQLRDYGSDVLSVSHEGCSTPRAVVSEWMRLHVLVSVFGTQRLTNLQCCSRHRSARLGAPQLPLKEQKYEFYLGISREDFSRNQREAPRPKIGFVLVSSTAFCEPSLLQRLFCESQQRAVIHI